MIKIKRGLNIPIQGAPQQVIEDAPAARNVALVGFDYVGMKPTMEVQEGDRVKLGQLLFTDKKTEGVRYTAPGAGTVSAINRGARRVLQSVVIELDGDEAERFDAVSPEQVASLGADAVREQLVQSGQWTALRTRPYSKVPAPDAQAAAIFVTAMDTHPLCADPTVIIAEQPDAFRLGQELLAKLTTGKVYVCAAEGADVPLGSAGNIEEARFSGPHPAGLAGTHIHFLEGVNVERMVWTVGYQDVIAIGRLFLDGQLYTERVIALSGPQVENPRLLRTRLGADMQALTAGQLKTGDNRVISGSVLGGRTVLGATAYLGRYHNQISVLLEGRHREFMGWFSPGAKKHSNLGIYLSNFLGLKPLAMTTNTNGSQRAMVPVGSYETVVPQDYLPTHLLRALIVGDTEMAQALGCLELEEEDLALCTYVCPGKYEYGPILRDNLTRIEKEG
jgi:Na+-transporting NADH:ubiquinone oxidoreductase subunit A